MHNKETTRPVTARIGALVCLERLSVFKKWRAYIPTTVQLNTKVQVIYPHHKKDNNYIMLQGASGSRHRPTHV